MSRAGGLLGLTLALHAAGCSWLSGKGEPFWTREDLGPSRAPRGMLAAVLADRAPQRTPLPDELQAVASTSTFKLERVLGRAAMTYPEPAWVAFLPDGRLLSIGQRGDLRFWDPITRTQLSSFPGCAAGNGGSLKLSPDGKLVAHGTKPGWICVVDLANGRVVRHWQAHGAPIRALGFTAAGEVLSFGYQQEIVVTGSMGSERLMEEAGGDLRRWRLKDDDPIEETHLGSATEMVISADGTLVVGRDAKGTLHAWDGNGRVLWAGTEHWHAGFALVDHDRQLFVAESRRLHLLDARTGAERGDLTPTTPRFLWFGTKEVEPWRPHVYVTPDGRAITAANNDSFFYVWDVARRREVAHPSSLVFAGGGAYSPDGTLLVGWDLALWDAVAYQPLPYRPVYGLSISTDGRRALVTSQGTTTLWDVERGAEVVRRRLAKSVSLALSAGADRMLVGFEDGWARLYDVATGAPLWWLSGRASNGPWRLSPDGRLALTSSYELGLAVHDVTTGKELWKAPLPAYSHAIAGFSPDGRLVAHVDRDERVTIRRAADGVEVRRFGESKSRTALTFSPDGRYLLVDEHMPVFVDAGTGTEVRRIDVFQGMAALGPDGLVAFSARQTSHTVDLSRLPDGAPLGKITLDPRFGVVTALAISADGKRLLVGTENGQTLVLAR